VCALVLDPVDVGVTDLCLTKRLWFRRLRRRAVLFSTLVLSHRLMGSCSRTCSAITQQSSGYSSHRSSHG